MSKSHITRRGLVAGAGAGAGLAAASSGLVRPAHADPISDAFDQFVSQIGPGLFPLPPRSDTLNGHVPDLQGLARDGLGIINQLQSDSSLDGGDSAHREGVAAFCNGAQDSDLLYMFENGGTMRRHPTQAPWNNPKNCTRDQLIGYTAGCWRAGRLDINRRLLLAHATRVPPFTCQDTEDNVPGSTKNPPIGDPLGPDDVMYLRICAGDNGAFMDAAGQFVLQVAAELAGTDKTVDKNNLLLHCIVCGRLNLFVKVVPNWEDTLRYYWSGWRRQGRMAEELIWVVKKELERYPTTAIPLLPAHTIELLRQLDLKAELKNLDPLHHAQLASKFAEAALQDAADTMVNTLQVGLDEGTAQLSRLGASVDQVAKAFAGINQAPNAIRSALKANGFPDPLISQALQRAFPSIPHVDTATVPHVDVGAQPHGDVGAVHADVGAVHADANVVGVHTDRTVTPHVDRTTTPHIDVAPKAHIDTPPTLHVDTP